MQSSYLENILENLAQKKELISIFVPGIWLNHQTNSPVKINFRDFLTDKILEILKSPAAKSKKKSAWTNDVVIYNLLLNCVGGGLLPLMVTGTMQAPHIFPDKLVGRRSNNRRLNDQLLKIPTCSLLLQ